MSGYEPSGVPPATSARMILKVTVVVLFLTAVVVVTGVGLADALGRRADAATWARWSDVGQAFGVVNSVVSALAVAALLITWVLQTREMRAQWAEMTEQRHILQGAQAALHRSADVDVRKLHMTLTGMAIGNEHLAAVWPSHGGLDPITQSQYMYANLLIQHAWLQHTSGLAGHEEMVKNLRFLFASPKVRAFWRDTANSRRTIYVEGSEELGLATTADKIWAEYEDVLACSTESNTRPQPSRSWAEENVQTGDS
jgi:hypothetical protein